MQAACGICRDFARDLGNCFLLRRVRIKWLATSMHVVGLGRPRAFTLGRFRPLGPVVWALELVSPWVHGHAAHAPGRAVRWSRTARLAHSLKGGFGCLTFLGAPFTSGRLRLLDPLFGLWSLCRPGRTGTRSRAGALCSLQCWLAEDLSASAVSLPRELRRFFGFALGPSLLLVAQGLLRALCRRPGSLLCALRHVPPRRRKLQKR